MNQLPGSDISANELKQRLSAGEHLHLIDVREQLEFHTFNIGGSNIPLGSLSDNKHDLDISKEDEIIVICQRGIRSETARKMLATAGYKNVRNLSGGLLAYQRVI